MQLRKAFCGTAPADIKIIIILTYKIKSCNRRKINLHQLLFSDRIIHLSIVPKNHVGQIVAKI